MPRSLFLSALCANFVFGLLAARADDDGWARFRGPNGNGVANNQDIPIKFDEKTDMVWKVTIPGLGNSSPIVWKNQVFVQTSTDDGEHRLLTSLSTKTGETLWTRTLPAKKAPYHAKNTLASSTPATDGKAVYASFWDGKDIILGAYSIEAGKPLWEKNLGAWISEHGAGASPILYQDKVIFVNDMDRYDKSKNPVSKPSMLLALDKKTGNTVWEAPREAYRACYPAPIILEKPGSPAELIVTSTTAITSYDLVSGKENWIWRWTFTSKTPLRSISASFVSDGMLFAFAGDGGGDRQMYALSLDAAGAPKEVWQNKKDFPYVPCCLTSGPNIYFVNDRGVAGCFEAKTGKKIWLERLPEAVFSASPILVDGKIYAASEEGDVFVFAADTKFQLLARNNMAEMIRATPAVADGRLYVRGQRHLFCFSKKK